MTNRPIITPDALSSEAIAADTDSFIVERAGNLIRSPAGPFDARSNTFTSRTAAEAATVPASVDLIRYPVTINVTSGNDTQHIVEFVRDTGSLTAATGALATADGQVWVPAGAPTPLHFGAMGVASWSGGVPTPNLLSDVFANLAAAQAVYPEASALTETVDDMAFQKCADYVRDNRVFARGGQEVALSSVNNTGSLIKIKIPMGAYYLTRTWDLTEFRFGYTPWNLHLDGATIFGLVPDKPVIDMLGSRLCQITGTGTIFGLWTSDGVSRIGIQVGITNDRNSGDGHSFAGAKIKIAGRWKLAAWYNHASEYVSFGDMGLLAFNDLDHRVRHCSFDGSGGTSFTLNEEVTWTGGGSGFVRRSFGTTSGTIEIRVVSGTLADNTQITGATSGKVADIDGTPVQEPQGEGTDGRSYCVVQDGDNYWGVTSDYVTAPAADTAFSFLENYGVLDARHTGRGDALWVCRAFNHDYSHSYFVSSDPDGGAGIVLFSNTSATALDGITFSSHIETDAEDTDATTGLDYSVKFEAASAGTDVVVKGFGWRRNKAQVSLAQFYAGTNVDSVKIYGDINVDQVGRDAGQVMFSDPADFSVYGNITCFEDGTGPFFNISSLADVGGTVTCNARASANVRHASATYLLRDATGESEFMGTHKFNGIDFEVVESTWTPTLTDGSNTATTSSASGHYSRNGRWVTLYGVIVCTDVSSLSGGVLIGGLPLTSSGAGLAGGGSVLRALNLSTTAGHNLTAVVENGATTAVLNEYDGTGGTTPFNATKLTNTTTLEFEITYRVA